MIDEIQLVAYGKYTKKGKKGQLKKSFVFATLDFARTAIRHRRKPVSKSRTRMSRLKRKLIPRKRKQFILNSES